MANNNNNSSNMVDKDNGKDKPTSTVKDDDARRRKRRDRSRSPSEKRHNRHKRSRSRSRHRNDHRHHHHKKYHRSRSPPPRRRRSRSRSRHRRSSPAQTRSSPPPPPTSAAAAARTVRIEADDEKKRLQFETLQKWKEMAANDTLDLSQLSMDDMKKMIDVPKEIRSNQAATIMYQMEEIRKLIEQLTGISIPKIYNAGTVNPLQYAQQQRKRKLLWSKTNDNTSTSKVGAAITDGQDEKTAEKFRKLLGMKTGGSGNAGGDTDAIHQHQQDTFDSLDKEYQTARITTHLRRGVGLGFLSQGPFAPSSTNTEKD